MITFDQFIHLLYINGYDAGTDKRDFWRDQFNRYQRGERGIAMHDGTLVLLSMAA